MPQQSSLKQLLGQQCFSQMHDWTEQDWEGKQGGQSRNIEFKVRKRNVPMEKEQLYADNMQLRAKLQDAIETTTRLKTQLAVVQKQKNQLCNIAEEEIFQPKLPLRGNSAIPQKRSLTNIVRDKQMPASAGFSRDTKSIVTLKQMVRAQKEKNQQLHAQMQRLKKTLKNTRVNELTADNKELLEETLRLRKLNAEAKQIADLNYQEFANELEFLKKKLAQEREQEKRNALELKQSLELNAELKQKLRQTDVRRVDLEKRFMREIKELRKQNDTLRAKTRALQAQAVKFRPTESEQYIRLKKQYDSIKRRKEMTDKQVRDLKKEVEYLRQSNGFRKFDQKTRKTPTKQVNSPKASVQQSPHAAKVQKLQSEPKQEQKSRVHTQEVEIPKPELFEAKPAQPIEVSKGRSKPQDKSHSADTDKLLEVLEDQPHNNLNIESFYHKGKPEGLAQQEPKEPSKQEEEEAQFQPQTPPLSLQAKAVPVEKAQQSEEEEVLFRKEEEPEQKEEELVSKDELKMIRETLLYKFKAQGFTYEDFTRDLGKSGIKQFPVNQVGKMLVDEPFLLGQNAVSKILIYLFDSKRLTGDETIPVKSFTKKMKKFIGKAGSLDESRQNDNIFALRSLLEEDEDALRGFRDYCVSKAGEGNTISKNQFLKAMKSIGVEGPLLQTALAQQVYVSEDIEHLDFDLFLQHLTQDVPEGSPGEDDY